MDVSTPPSRIATVLAADASGYSRAMSLDEEKALAALAASRRIIDHSIHTRQGRIFSTGGDSVLAEFASNEEAVRCGEQIQHALAQASRKGMEVLSYRIGIHAGRVYISGEDLLGETVNIAARLESLANPGGICISGLIREGITSSSDLDIEEMGAQVLKGIKDPVKVARIRLGEPEQNQKRLSKFSLTVLPFRSSSNDAYWGEGLADDLVVALSRFGNIAVLTRTSGARHEADLDPRRVAADLGAHYVVGGAVRVQQEQFRLSVQLLDGPSGTVLWADRYDYAPDDLLAVQDRLVEKIVGTLAGRLEDVGARSSLRKRPENLGAFDFMLQGSFHANHLSPQSAHRAIDCFKKALAIDPDYAPALAMLAFMRLRTWALIPGAGDLEPVAELARRALELDPGDSWNHLVRGQVAMYQKELDLAEIHHKKAYALNPHDGRILALRSPLATYLGKPEEGRAWIEKAMQLDPHFPAWYSTNLGLALYCARQYGEASSVYESVAEPQAGVLAGLAACRAQLGDIDGARRARSMLLKATPDFSSAIFVAMRPFKYDLDREHLLEGLQKGALPA